jgi:mannan polymerase II complex MNN11 subunit
MKPTFVVIIAIGALTSIFLLFRVLVFSGTKSRSVAAFGVPSLGLANVVLDRQDASIKELVKKNREIYAQSHGKKTSGSLSWCH